MSKNSKSFVEPKILYLGQVLEEIESGKLRVPAFQRQFVWRPEQMLALLESIKDNYPIGSLLFWDTEEKVKSFRSLGPHKLPTPAKKDNYILDGHQRLSTLYGSLIKPKKTSEKEDWIWKLFYDLENEKFVHRKKNPFHHDIPLHALLRTIDVLKEGKRIEKELGDKAAIYIERAEKLAQTFSAYKVAIIQINGGDLNSAVEIFSRINSSGTIISKDQMLTALTYNARKGFNLSDKIDSILYKLSKYNFDRIDRTTIVRSILATSGSDMYDTELEKFAKNRNKKLLQYINATEKALISAARFFYEDLKVPGSYLLPYQLQLIFLAEFLRRCPNPSPDQKKLIIQWFWVTSYTGWFASANSTTVRKGLEEMRSIADNNLSNFSFIDFDEHAVPLPVFFNMRNARIRTFVLFLDNLNPCSLGNNNIIKLKDIFQTNGNKSLRYIISRRGETANRIISDNLDYKNEYKALTERKINRTVLKSHGITPEALTLLKKEDDDGFIEARQKELMELENKFMQKCGVKFGSVYSSTKSINDTI